MLDGIEPKNLLLVRSRRRKELPPVGAGMAPLSAVPVMRTSDSELADMNDAGSVPDRRGRLFNATTEREVGASPKEGGRVPLSDAALPMEKVVKDGPGPVLKM